MMTAIALAAPAVIGAPSDEVAGSSQAPIVSPGVGGLGSASNAAGLPEEAAMVLVGTALIGVAAAVRKAA
jgi:hypothetical protein